MLSYSQRDKVKLRWVIVDLNKGLIFLSPSLSVTFDLFRYYKSLHLINFPLYPYLCLSLFSFLLLSVQFNEPF